MGEQSRGTEAAPSTPLTAGGATIVNDVHSQLNPTRVAGVVPIRSVDGLQAAVRQAGREGRAICVGGGWHAMGAQQFATDGILLDTRPFRGVHSLDTTRGLVEVEAGIQWPELIDYLIAAQAGNERQWGIRQKQTGADRLSIGGAVSANAHGRGLTLSPFVGDVEALTIVNAAGELVRCSRTENTELFGLVIGGYGLFGAIATVTLRLDRRRKIQRVVELETVDHLPRRFEERIADGYRYGDCQFALDPKSPDFLHAGIFSCYRPVPDDTPMPEDQRSLSADDWTMLLHLAHTDKSRGWEMYSKHYLATSGQIYWSDTHQLSTYIDDYHEQLDETLGVKHPGSEIITEVYVPRPQLADFLAEVAADFRRHNVDCIYGTIRLIERDDETVLAWAKEAYACIIFNLHTEHTPAGIEHSAEAFRRLIDMASARGGSYFLTYHKFATREQVERCYPRFSEFLRLKQRYDPDGRFQSDWYRHHVALFGGR